MALISGNHGRKVVSTRAQQVSLTLVGITNIRAPVRAIRRRHGQNDTLHIFPVQTKDIPGHGRRAGPRRDGGASAVQRFGCYVPADRPAVGPRWARSASSCAPHVGFTRRWAVSRLALGSSTTSQDMPSRSPVRGRGRGRKLEEIREFLASPLSSTRWARASRAARSAQTEPCPAKAVAGEAKAASLRLQSWNSTWAWVRTRCTRKLFEALPRRTRRLYIFVARSTPWTRAPPRRRHRRRQRRAKADPEPAPVEMDGFDERANISLIATRTTSKASSTRRCCAGEAARKT